YFPGDTLYVFTAELDALHVEAGNTHAQLSMVFRFSQSRQSPLCGGAAGSCTVTQSPPAVRGVRVRVPSCAWVMLLTIARPRPTPAWLVRTRSVPRRNGSTSVETNCGVSFSPVFSTVSTTLLG